MSTTNYEPCTECGLRFSDGKRTFSTFGRPTIRLSQHRRYHADEKKRAIELRGRADEVNALPFVVPHEKTEDECDRISAAAEADVFIQLPVVEPSRTTGKPEEGFHLGEYRRPTSAQLARHVKLYGPEGVPGFSQGKSRKTTTTLKAQVADLHARGMIAAAIADSLNIGDRRVKAILRSL